MSFMRHQAEEHDTAYGESARRIAEHAEHPNTARRRRFNRIRDMEVTEYVDDYPKEEEERKTPVGLGSAISFATVIQNKFPRRLLCGSLALILYKAIPERRIGDLDFVSYEVNVKENETVSLKCSTPHKHCLFLSSSVKEGETIHGLKLQNLDQMIYWKKKYGREQDLKDLEGYMKSQYFTEEEFLIDL